jgi:hypothetical protein
MTTTRKRKATFVSEKENDETCNFFLKAASMIYFIKIQTISGNQFKSGL